MRLSSVSNIAKITKSMKMIASTKMTRATRTMNSARIYGATAGGKINYSFFVHILLRMVAACLHSTLLLTTQNNTNFLKT